MPSYRDVFRTPEFTPLFLNASVQTAAQTVAGLALATLVYGRTGSPLLAALAMFGPALAQLAGATTLLAAADRLPPRAAICGLALLTAAGTAVQALPGLPLAASFAVLFALGVASSPGGGVRYGLLHEVLTREGYLAGRSVLNISAGLTQICGYAGGGALVALLSPRGTLLVAAALNLVAVAVARAGLRRRAPRAAGRPSPAVTWRADRLLWSDPRRRAVLLALWVPNGLIVGCESLFVPYAPGHSGTLFAFAAAGMLTGDVLTGRFLPPHRRRRLGAPLRLLLAVPYLAFALRPPPAAACALVTLASVGYAASLLLQERLMALTPPELSGHALGLHSSGMLAMQGVGAALAGAAGEVLAPGRAMAVVAVASVAVTLWLGPRLRDGGNGPAAAAGERATEERNPIGAPHVSGP